MAHDSRVPEWTRGARPGERVIRQAVHAAGCQLSRSGHGRATAVQAGTDQTGGEPQTPARRTAGRRGSATGSKDPRAFAPIRNV